jgi:tRNA A-37 threonylcarbamoyl transferase component Bud32
MKECTLETYTIGVGKEHVSSVDSVQECILTAAHKKKGDLLGCGEQGCTYKLVEDPSHVIKVTHFADPKSCPLHDHSCLETNKQKWRAEACLGRDIGTLGIAPKISKIFECQNSGFIIMDILRDLKKLPDGTKIREGTKDDPIDHISRIPESYQRGFIQALWTMIEKGYVHMDNHTENLGFIGETAVVFDFGFTQVRAWKNDHEKLYALAFSLFQILEHVETSELDSCGLIWDVATSILRNTVKWRNLSTYVKTSVKELENEFPLPVKKNRAAKLAEFRSKAKRLSTYNWDIIEGTWCYATLITSNLFDRPTLEPFISEIYDIRQGKTYITPPALRRSPRLLQKHKK